MFGLWCALIMLGIEGGVNVALTIWKKDAGPTSRVIYTAFAVMAFAGILSVANVLHTPAALYALSTAP